MPLPDFRSYLPSPHTLREHRLIRWLSPWLGHPRLWHANRRGIALGVAIGVFFGLLIPLAQIPFSVAAALLLRANIPAAAASTLVTNPITFTPVYFAAYHLGVWLLGHEATHLTDAELGVAANQAATGLALWMERLADIGLPLALGLGVMAVTISPLLYFVVSGMWRLRTVRAWRARHPRRRD